MRFLLKYFHCKFLCDFRMIPLMKGSLCLADQHGQTILHKCCDMLRQDMPRIEFFLDCLRSLVDYTTMQGWGEIIYSMVDY